MPRILSPGGNIFCKFGKEAAVCLDKTIIYTRDAGGNVTQKKVYPLVHRKTWKAAEQTDICLCRRWKDQVTAVDGQTVAYDTAGNVISIQRLEIQLVRQWYPDGCDKGRWQSDPWRKKCFGLSVLYLQFRR